MEYFNKRLNVDVHDVDHNGVAKASALMRYIQSAAQEQLSENGMSYDKLKDNSRAFILSKIKMEFTESLRAHEPLTAVTFPCHSRGFTFLRCYKLLRDNETVGRAVSAWALIDTEKRALVRVNDFDLGLQTYDPLDMPLERIVMPSELDEVGSYTVNYGDVDQNMHMNNTRYPDMYSNFLPLDGMRIKDITISYINEAPASDTLKVLREECNGVFYIRTVRSDGKINTEAQISLCKIK